MKLVRIEPSGELVEINVEEIEDIFQEPLDIDDYQVIEILELGDNMELYIIGSLDKKNGFNMYEFQYGSYRGYCFSCIYNVTRGVYEDLSVDVFIQLYESGEDLDDCIMEDEIEDLDDSFESSLDGFIVKD